ncbi:MAG: histone acetyl transferase HAT1 N-terminus-domain-containing protein [Olpidium bornovanus]|uniref:Histone acetyltransferase type B catalytic subunit n=1 Tax=Olpidium bornovanus TaxID=278681 RepID=A0A8H8DMF9_9FUNG|nr:MAG: histone acetyl transferase HAT1 N-terminus-domain-containing protein [Olpidium bornovanus]
MVASCNDWVSDSNAAFVLSLARTHARTHTPPGIGNLSDAPFYTFDRPVRPARDQGDEGEDRNAAAATFPPEFTYPLFAEERLFGYQAPRIDLQFASGSLVPYYSFTYRRAVPEAEGKPDDVVGELRKWLPEDDVEFTDHDLFMARAALDHATFRPLGDKVHEYRTKAGDGDGGDDVVYEIHKSSFDDPQFAKYFRRAQIFNIFFIEGATFLDEDDRWEIMTM